MSHGVHQKPPVLDPLTYSGTALASGTHITGLLRFNRKTHSGKTMAVMKSTVTLDVLDHRIGLQVAMVISVT